MPIWAGVRPRLLNVSTGWCVRGLIKSAKGLFDMSTKTNRATASEHLEHSLANIRSRYQRCTGVNGDVDQEFDLDDEINGVEISIVADEDYRDGQVILLPNSLTVRVFTPCNVGPQILSDPTLHERTNTRLRMMLDAYGLPRGEVERLIRFGGAA